MTSAQLAAVSYLARYARHTHDLYAAALRRWFGWCKTNRLDPSTGVQRGHVELDTAICTRPACETPQ